MRSKEGAYAWLVTGAAFGVNFLLSASIGTYGILFVEIMDRYEATKAGVSIIASLQIGLNFAAIMIGYLVKRFGHQPMGILAISLQSGGSILAMFAHDLWVLYLTLGIMQGFAFATHRIAAIIPLHKYFNQRKSLAIAVANTGFTTGLVIWPLLTWWLIELYTLQGALLIIAGIFLNGLVFYLVMSDPDPDKTGGKPQIADMKVRPKGEGDGVHRAQSGTETVQGSLATADTITKTGDSSLHTTEEDEVSRRGAEAMETHIKKRNDEVPDVILHNIQSKDGKITPEFSGTDDEKRELPKENLLRQIGLHWYGDLSYSLWMVGFCITYCGTNLPTTFITPRAVQAGHTEPMAALLVTIGGLCGFLLTPVMGLLGDKLSSMRSHMYALSHIMNGTFCIVTVVSDNYYFLMGFMLASTLCVATVKIYQFITPVELWGPIHAPVILGHMFCWSGAGSFVGFTMIGALWDTLDEPGQVFAVVGSLQVLGGLMSLAAVCLHVHKHKLNHGCIKEQ